MATLIASYAGTIGQYVDYIGTNAGFQKKAGNSFQGNGYILDSAKFYLYKTGSPTGNATVSIYAHTGTFGSTGKGTGAALATSGPLDVSTLTTSFVQKTFTFSGANKITLTNGTYYVVVVEYTGGNSSNYIVASISDVATRYGNYCFVDQSDTWGYYGTLSGAFEVYGDQASFGTAPTLQRTRYRDALGAVGQTFALGATYGYFGGGNSGSRVTTVDKITYSTGVTAVSTVSALSQARQLLTGITDKVTYGYFTGGQITTYYKITDRITFSTSVAAANTVSDLSLARAGLYGISSGTTYGYFAGGYADEYFTTADRITFSTGVTAANTGSNLSLARNRLSGVSDGATYGYFVGGYDGSVYATADRITFSTSATAANTASNLSTTKYLIISVSDGSTYGYFAGGGTVGGASYVSTADRIVFSTGVTSSNTVSNLSTSKRGGAGASDGYTYGYFAGGADATNNIATCDRITFSTGATSAANTSSNLSVARFDLAGLSDLAI